MAFASHRKNFRGVLAGLTFEDIKQLDYNKTLLKERKNYIEEKYIRIKDYLDTYIFTKEENVDGGSLCKNYSKEELAQYYKYNLNKEDDLSAEINIFKSIESDASFLLNSKDLPRDKEQQYKFLNEEDFKKLIKREESLSNFMDSEDSDENVMSILERSKRNDYINMQHKIKKEDFTHKDAGQVLSDYDKFRNYLKSQMEKIKNKEKSTLTLYQAKKHLKEVNDDMIRAKIDLRGIRAAAKRLGDESGMFYSEDIDYTNPSHVKNIIKFVRFGELQPDSDLSHLAYDMRVAIDTLFKNKEIDSIDMEIIECFNAGYTNLATAKEINRDEKVVRRRLDKIFNKISSFYKK